MNEKDEDREEERNVPHDPIEKVEHTVLHVGRLLLQVRENAVRSTTGTGERYAFDHRYGRTLRVRPQVR